MGHFATIFAPKLVTFFNLLRPNVVDVQNSLLGSSISLSRMSADIQIDVTSGTKITSTRGVYMRRWQSKDQRDAIVSMALESQILTDRNPEEKKIELTIQVALLKCYNELRLHKLRFWSQIRKVR